jgi:hypothetical protein
MATLFPDYQQLVMRAYERKKVNNTLPHGLMYLTPAKLKDECVKRCTKEVNRRDEKVIRDFCGDLNESRSCHAIIQRCDTDKFRPLVNYLKGRSESTDEKNIELLAWLIDFSGRPWELGKTVSGDDDKGPALNDASQATGDQATASDSTANPPTTGSEKPAGNPIIPENPIIPAWIGGSKGKESEGVKIAETSHQEKLRAKSTKGLVAAVMLSLVLGTGSMWWWKDKNQPPAPSGSCMYWLEDHYESIACNQKIPNARVIALDTMRLKNFRKITRPDTITYQAIGKVWYSKINDKVEYYTSGGEHPVVFNRQLKPITVYIIDKYILPGMITE